MTEKSERVLGLSALALYFLSFNLLVPGTAIALYFLSAIGYRK